MHPTECKHCARECKHCACECKHSPGFTPGDERWRGRDKRKRVRAHSKLSLIERPLSSPSWRSDVFHLIQGLLASQVPSGVDHLSEVSHSVDQLT
ncbi:hypothetical protein J6590_093252 [Homalodisca vitripennis]|nr:hypothetical protein J6590_093252 [Homalodisca vitripennis]